MTINDSQILKLRREAASLNDNSVYDLCSRALTPDNEATWIASGQKCAIPLYTLSQRTARLMCAHILSAGKN